MLCFIESRQALISYQDDHVCYALSSRDRPLFRTRMPTWCCSLSQAAGDEAEPTVGHFAAMSRYLLTNAKSACVRQAAAGAITPLAPRGVASVLAARSLKRQRSTPGHWRTLEYPFVWGKRGTKRVLEYGRLAMGFAIVRASRYGIR